MFRALMLSKSADDKPEVSIEYVDDQQLPPGDVTINVRYSSVNYKDGLAVTGKGKIVRDWPMVPGIDFAGVVETSSHADFHPGDEVILTGWGVGEKHWGGMAEKARVHGDWLVPLPSGLSARQSMIIGTAGLTAMLCVQALEENGIAKEQGPVAVSGASGGVGSTAVAILAASGYDVIAISGREDNTDWLKQLGASEVWPRQDFMQPGRPLNKQQLSGAIDTVGGYMLTNLLARTFYRGCVAACGLAGDMQLPATVMPFILRNIRLQGVDSVQCPKAERMAAWQQLAARLPELYFDKTVNEVTIEQVPQVAEQITNGQVRGRTLVKCSQ